MNRLFVAVTTTLLLSLPTLARAQAADYSGRPQLTRSELQDRLVYLQELSGSEAQSREVRDKAQEEAEMVRGRLEKGDIRVGDQIALDVQGEADLSDTFTVRTGEVLVLPGIGEVPVGGILRSELNSRLSEVIGEYVRNPVVRASSLVRVSITGRVGQPGFYGLGAEQLLSDAIMAAGGPGPDADLTRIHIDREGRQIWSGEYLQKAIAEGRTLDQLSLQAGDMIVVPPRSQGLGGQMWAAVTGLASVAVLLVTVFR